MPTLAAHHDNGQMPDFRRSGLDATDNHGVFPGAARSCRSNSGVSTQGTLSGHSFSPAFAAAKFESWFYDSSASNNSRQGLQVRCHDGGGTKRPSTTSAPTRRARVVQHLQRGLLQGYGSAWTWQGRRQARSSAGTSSPSTSSPTPAPGTRSSSISTTSRVATVERTLDTQTYGLNMVAYGYHYRVNQTGWFDDCAMYASRRSCRL